MNDEGDRLSCGAVIVRQTDDGWLTLMLRAYHNWDFPKVICEEGESPMDAAIREIGDRLDGKPRQSPDLQTGVRAVTVSAEPMSTEGTQDRCVDRHQ